MEREPAAFLALLRQLLFSAAPYVLGSFGPPCALRDLGGGAGPAPAAPACQKPTCKRLDTDSADYYRGWI